MAGTLWSTVITDAINRSLMNAQATTPLAQDSNELLRTGSRLMRRIYQLAGLPRPVGDQRGNFFVVTGSVTLSTPSTTLVALPSSPEVAHILQVTDNAGTPVACVSLVDVRQGRAEFPPGVLVQNGKIRSAGRLGDPAAAAVLTVDYSYLAPSPTSIAHYIGATTLTDGDTTAWPVVGNAWLVDALATYLEAKDHRPPSAALAESLAETRQVLAETIGVDLAKLQVTDDA